MHLFGQAERRVSKAALPVAQQLRSLVLQVTLADNAVIMDLVDVDGDGRVSLQDFRSFLDSCIFSKSQAYIAPRT
jgi:hypothetical protein